MDLKRLVTQFAYKIEAKPDGGFIARATDPSVPPLEAPTREELQRSIQQNILNALSTEFPQLKAAAEGQKLEMAFHVERTPQGGFEIHSADPGAPVIQAANQTDLESHFLEKFLNFAGKHIVPELSQALAAQAGSGNVKVVVNKKMSFHANLGTQGITFGSPKAPGIGAPTPDPANFPAINPDAPTLAGTIDGRPITPEAGSNWNALLIALLFLFLGAVMYFFFRFR
jgi:hypothetical protein